MIEIFGIILSLKMIIPPPKNESTPIPPKAIDLPLQISYKNFYFKIDGPREHKTHYVLDTHKKKIHFGIKGTI